MSLLIRIDSLTYSISGRKIFSDVNHQFTSSERTALIGHNGAGKSTFFKLLMNQLEPDSGRIEVMGRPVIRLVDQALPIIDGPMTLRAYHEKIVIAMGYEDPITITDFQLSTEYLLNDLPLTMDTDISTLSGGLLRLVQIVVSLSIKPAVLLLDEPTNHLDINHILWLELQLKRFTGLLIFISHDRQFIENVATKLCELEQGKFHQWPTVFSEYMNKKAQFLDEQARRSEHLAKLVSRELQWLNRGVKARRKRNQGRVRRLDVLKDQMTQQKQKPSTLKLSEHDVERSGQKVITLDEVSFSYCHQPIITDFSLNVGRKDRIVLIGANGSGKTTLIELMLKQLEPSSGQVTHGTNLSVAYFDQKKAQLDTSLSIIDNVSGSNQVSINGQMRHISSYLADFSFDNQQIHHTVSSLSGGEKSRVLLAKLLLKPTNVLVMDEPTNDLDMTTLLALEQYINDYPGTVLIITHDRYFLNQIATKVLVFKSSDNIIIDAPPVELSYELASGSPDKKKKKTKSLNYADQKRLSRLPSLIEKLESKKAELEKDLADAKWYASDHNHQDWIVLNESYQSIIQQINDTYQEWEDLENS